MEILDSKVRIEKLIENGYELDISKYISEAWELFKKSAGLYILYALLVFLINGIVPGVSIVVGAALFAGYYVATQVLDKTGKHQLEDFFKSFNYFLPLFLSGLIGGILVSVGLVLFILPGIWLAVALSFSYQLIVFAKMDFWQSIETSVKIINKKWFSFLWLWIVIIGINILGAIPLGLGLLITVPLTALIFYCCYKDVVGLDTEKEYDLTDHIV